MNIRYFAGLDVSEGQRSLIIWDQQEKRVRVLARTRLAIRFWLVVCRVMRIRVIVEIN